MFPRKRHWKRAIALIEKLYDITVHQDSRKGSRNHSDCWWKERQTIWLATHPENSASEILSGLAHELGHCLSVRKGAKTTMHMRLVYNMASWHQKVFTKKQKKVILAEEYQSNRLGFKFLRDNGFPVTKKMLRKWRTYVGTHIHRLNCL